MVTPEGRQELGALASARTAPPLADPHPRSAPYELSVRLFDLAVGLVLLVVTLPLWVILAVIIRLDSRGPAIFRQTRIGRGLRPFRFYKFRTMRTESRLSVLPAEVIETANEDELGAIFLARMDDDRVTRAGKWLRSTSLDELPNLLNIVKGDMSLVGPRPEVPEVMRLYRDRTKFAVKPGLTGLAQVNGRAFLSFAETVALDVEYVRTRSWRTNVRILARTVGVVLRSRGAF